MVSLWGTNELDVDREKLVVEAARSLDDARLSDLVDNLVKDKGLKFNDAAEAVYVMWKKGTLDLVNPNRPSALSNYIFSLESLWFWAVSAFVFCTVLVTFFIVNSPFVYVRYVLGGVFVLFLPGWMFMAALYPRGEDIDGFERLALSVGLSLAIVPLVGLFLNYTPWGITLSPIMISLSLLAEGFAFLAMVRKFRYFSLSGGVE
jgi:hypothetical protein